MAKEILFDPPKPNPKAALLKRVAEIPDEHAEALLDAAEILQLMRDKGLLELAKGLLGSGEKVLEIATETLQSNEALAMIRNVTILTKILGGLNPAVLEEVEAGFERSVNEAHSRKPPSMFAILRTITSEESRKTLSLLGHLLESIGKNLNVADVSGRKRKKVYKHNA